MKKKYYWFIGVIIVIILILFFFPRDCGNWGTAIHPDAKYKDCTLVFVEVKTMHQYPKHGLKPEDQLTKAKLRKTQKAASLYAGHYPEKVNEKKGWRIDLIALTLRHDSGSILSESNRLTISGENCDIRHYENIS